MSVPPPSASPAPSLPGWSFDAVERRALRMDRARTELQHGRPLALRAGPGQPGLLIAAVETLGAAGWSRWQSGRGALRLLLSAERLQALSQRGDAEAAHLPVPTELDLAGLQALAAVQARPDQAPGGAWGLDWPAERRRAFLASAQPADAAEQAALRLAKLGPLSPALLRLALPADTLDAAVADGLVEIAPQDIEAARGAPRALLRRLSDAHVPITAHEDCTLVLFRELHGETEHLALVVGQPDRSQPVPVRLHSSCFTGDLLGSLRCDCGDQLQGASERLAEDGGVLLYLAQEGRGTGLASKLRAYRLQDTGLDTLDADRYLGFRADERDFQAAAAMLDALGIARIRLLTNNPAKIEALRAAGIDVVDRLPLVVPSNPHNARYLATKRDRAGHLRDDEQA